MGLAQIHYEFFDGMPRRAFLTGDAATVGFASSALACPLPPSLDATNLKSSVLGSSGRPFISICPGDQHSSNQEADVATGSSRRPCGVCRSGTRSRNLEVCTKAER